MLAATNSLGIASIHEAVREPAHQTALPVDLAQQYRAAVAGDGAAVEVRDEGEPTGILQLEPVGFTVCLREPCSSVPLSA